MHKNIYPSSIQIKSPFLPITLPTNPYPNSYSLIQTSSSLLRKYQVPLHEFLFSSHLSQWRKHTFNPIPKIISTQHVMNSITREKFVHVVTQHMVKNIKEVRMQMVEQVIYCCSQMVMASQEMLARLGYVALDAEFVGINANGNLLVWIGSNFCSYQPQSKKLTNQKQIILKIITILEYIANEKSHILLTQLKKLSQLKFKYVLDFILTFKNKHKLRIIPKIVQTQTCISIPQSIHNSNTKSVLKRSNVFGPSVSLERHLSLKNSNTMKSSHSSNFLSTSRVNNPSMLVVSKSIKKVSREKEVIAQQPSTPVLMTGSITQQRQQGPKINFSYSQKRDNIFTPKQSGFIKDYTSVQNIIFTSSILSPTPIKQFTLQDNPTPKQKKQFKLKIIPIYTISYIPSTNTTCLKTSISSSLQQYPNKTSMTTNHRSAITQSQSKESYQDEHFARDRWDTHRNTISVIRDSFVDSNQVIRNHASFVANANYHNERRIDNYSSNNHSATYCSQPPIKPNQMYTFGGLITTAEEQLEESSLSRPASSIDLQQNSYVQPQSQQGNICKKIQQLYRNISSPSMNHELFSYPQQKQCISIHKDSCSSYQSSLQSSPIHPKHHQTHNQSSSLSINKSFIQPIHHHNESFTKQKLQSNDYSNQNQFKIKRTLKNLLTPKVVVNEQFDYNMWKGITGLLNQNGKEMKQSIHVGPDIRTPTNIKLDLLGKFGREIGQSIIPNTPGRQHYDQNYTDNSQNKYYQQDNHSYYH